MPKFFSELALAEGKIYYREGHILELKTADGLLKARVRGNSNSLYNIHIDLRSWPEAPARCTCPFLKNCKHVAACFFYFLDGLDKPLPLKSHNPSTIAASQFIVKDFSSLKNAPKISQNTIFGDQVEWFSKNLFPMDLKNEFFSYQLGITIGGEEVNIIPLLVELIRNLDKNYLDALPESSTVQLSLKNGKVLQIELKRIKPFLRFLMQYGLHKIELEESLNLSAQQIILMEEIEQAILATSKRWLGTKKIREQLKYLVQFESIPQIEAPQGLTASLRDYQRTGLNWLQLLRKNHFGGILADDMGLGKTIQTLSNLQAEKEAGRLKKASLIIAPTSLLSNWLDEINRFSNLKALVFHGTSRSAKNFDHFEIIISSYGLIHREKTRFVNYSFYYLILDEAQLIKNARTKSTQIVQQIPAKHRLCLSGTPLQNHLGELWSLFNFLMPGLLGTAKQFKKNFKDPIELNNDQESKLTLLKRVQPFLLRRTKDQVARELPMKTEIIQEVDIVGAQRDLYEIVRISTEKKIRDAIYKLGINRSHIVFLDALLKLRQVCCDPKLLSLEEAKMAHGTSAKLDLLMELLASLISEGRYVLVFSQFTSMLEIIEEKLNELNYPYLKLTGKTTSRGEIVQLFQEGGYPIFLISLKAGGIGLNLTRADTVIHYDPWWNPAAEEQATDRSHRIGQINPVFVYKLIAKGTVEEAILKMQKKKQKLFDSVLTSESQGINTLTMEEINEFFK